MSTTIIGRQAEETATGYLQKSGYKIQARNWRTRWCEIDIVALKDQIVYFVEVKYRKQSNFGDGLEVITAKKLRQMEFSAQMWVNDNDWPGDCRLLAINVAGQPLMVIDCVEI